MSSLLIRIAIAVSALGFCGAALAAGELPIEASDFPGRFVMLTGDDVEDEPPSLIVQVGDGGDGFLSQGFRMDQPVVPEQPMLLPEVDAEGDTTASLDGFLIDRPGFSLEVIDDGEPLGYIRLRPDGSRVDVELSTRVNVVFSLGDEPAPPIETELIFTTGHAHATAKGTAALLFRDTDLDGTPFDAVTGEGVMVSAFNIPEDLPQDVIDGFNAILADSDLPLDASVMLGAALGFEMRGTLMPLETPEPDLEGDVNGDDCVNVADLLSVRSNLGEIGSSISPAGTDVNGDDLVNIADLLVVRGRLGQGSCE